MKKLITIVALTLSVGAFAQVTEVLDKSDETVGSSKATLIRTLDTKDKFEVTFQNIPLEFYRCTQSHVQTRTYACGTTSHQVGTRNVPTCVEYYPGTNRCRRMETRTVPVMRNETRYCTSTDVICDQKQWVTESTNDKVKIKFKNLPDLAGTETESFLVEAFQKDRDFSNVSYRITPISTLNGATYVVEKKGILGYDSYVIEPK